MLRRLSVTTSQKDKPLSPTTEKPRPTGSPVKPVVAAQLQSPRLKLNPALQDDNQAVEKVELVDEIIAQLTQLISRMDDVKPTKLRSVRLGGELRGLLGKAEDEVSAHAETFKTYAPSSPGLHIQLQNFLASLHGLLPTIEAIHAKKFLVNTFVKRSIQFAFQEISSYYSSIFTELSLAVAKATGSAAEAAVLAALSKPPEEAPVEDEEDTVDYDAMCLLGHRHFFGHGKEKDMTQAFRLYLEAAKNKQVDAMVCVGRMLRDGLGTDSDMEAAQQWFTQAAEEGSIDGVAHLGLLLMDKAAVATHPQKKQETYAMAIVRLVQAADRGIPSAQYAAGNIYLMGKLGSVDRIKAQEWFVKASALNDPKADLALGKLFYEEPDKVRATHHFLKASKDVETATEACYYLGRIYTLGEDIKADRNRGEAYFRQAADAGHTAARVELAELLLPTDPIQAFHYLLRIDNESAMPHVSFLRGCVFESPPLRSLPTALRHYAAAAELGHAKAALRAAAMHYSGLVEPKMAPNRAKAYAMYEIAAAKKDAEALNALGLMCEEGQGCPLDLAKAAAFLREAAALESAHGHFNYGCLLQHGKGVEKNSGEAKWHFQQAMQLGYTQAKRYCDPSTAAPHQP
ncbi:Aste57867_1055 [Aphanomyces stellatus]|uniref:Aste57867_1055 protein n=1 Tax=Aphanomyces stellatus TaxID=120398 RepID=A0A485K8D4_9STRA|nr:hypothetical protein As57867_001054 [Aphanomyces stellatus]VFT78277.1 Aste57867_1055 [Aphanomyces stellatus]